MDLATVIAFTLYISMVVGIAVAAYWYTRNLSDFVLGGRKLGGAVAALSAGASDMSAWLLLGLPGAVYSFGLNQVWLPIGLIIGAYINWKIVAKPLRIYTERANDSVTVPAFLDNRFHDQSGLIRIVSALATLIFFAFYTASGLVAGALLMGRAFGLDYHTALMAGTAIIVAYTFIGGFLAVSWTDFIQGNLMFVCLIAVPILAAKHLGGISTTLDTIKAIDPKLLIPTSGITILGTLNLLSWGLGYIGQPHILVRFMSVKSAKKDIPVARTICMWWMSLSMIGAVLCGLAGIPFFENNLANPETVFISFANELFSPWLSGLIMAAILSSTMCAIDSQMLASSSALTEDIYHALIRRNAKPKELMWIGRVAVVIIACAAIALASNPNSTVLTLVGFAWAGLGATFGPPVVLALFWKRMTRNGCVLGMVLGALTVFLWKFTVNVDHELIYEIIPGFLASTSGVVFGSIFDKKPNRNIKHQFNTIKAEIAAT